jgi:hypothetical protein
MLGSPELHSLSSVKYLYLGALSEPKDNSLCLVVDEAVENRSGPVRLAAPKLPELENTLKDAWRIESTEVCGRFELSWKRVVVT